MPEKSGLKTLLDWIALVTAVVAFALHFVRTSPTCREYQSEHPFDVACNARTEPGYYWQNVGRAGPYGSFGLGNTGDQPICGGRGGLGTRAQSRLWKTDETMTPAETRYCRGLPAAKPGDPSPNAQCEPVGQEGPETEKDNLTIGVFNVECREIPWFRNPLR